MTKGVIFVKRICSFVTLVSIYQYSCFRVVGYCANKFLNWGYFKQINDEMCCLLDIIIFSDMLKLEFDQLELIIGIS